MITTIRYLGVDLDVCIDEGRLRYVEPRDCSQDLLPLLEGHREAIRNAVWHEEHGLGYGSEDGRLARG